MTHYYNNFFKKETSNFWLLINQHNLCNLTGMKNILLSLAITSLMLSGCAKDVNLSEGIQMQPSSPEPVIGLTETTATSPAIVSNETEPVTAVLNTSKGTIKLKLYADKAPNTVNNFIEKSKSGYYQNLKFHRVEDWVIQGGDPTGTGRGGNSMPSEINDLPFKAGSLGIARGADIKINNDSQFFICTKECDWLNNLYTNFGEVVSGMEVAQKITTEDTIKSIIIE